MSQPDDGSGSNAGSADASADADARDAPEAAEVTEAVTALVQADEAAAPSFWRRFGDTLKKAAVATGQGTVWLARTGYENRHYLPAIINGAVGDKLARSGQGLAIPMALRDERGDLDLGDLGPTLRAGSGHVTVFVHGLMASDVYWREPFGGGEGMGPMLARSAGVTPLYVRYNSGLHISHNGRALAALLDQLVQRHGDHIQRISLIGHSMGGLVVRSAGHYGHASWTQRTAAVVMLGVPNDGAYLEQLSHMSALVLDAVPNLSTKIIARVIDQRSDGIKDLRIGVLVDEDWQRPDAAQLASHQRTPVPLLPGVDYHVVAGTLLGDADSAASWLACYLGDGMVGTRSALGSHVTCRVFPSTSHLALVAHPEVHAHVRDALTAQKV